MYIEIEIKEHCDFFRSNNVPKSFTNLRGVTPKVNVTTGCMHPIDDINRMRILHALFPGCGFDTSGIPYM